MWPLSLFKVKDRSMEPNIKEGDYVLVNKLSYLTRRPSQGDIIVFKDPQSEMFFLKRVEALEGQKVFVGGDNKRLSAKGVGQITKDLIVGKVSKILSG